MMRAYFAAKSVAIIGDYTCYYHQKRVDGTHIAGQGIEPYGYFADLADIIEIVERNTDPGEFRNSILRRFYRTEMLGRFRDDRVSRYEPDFLRRLFDAEHRLAKERIPVAVRQQLPPVQRQLSDLLYAGDLEGLRTFCAHTSRLRAHARVDRAEVTADRHLLLHWTAELRVGKKRVVNLVADENGVTIDPRLLGGVRIRSGRSMGLRVYLVNPSAGDKIALEGTRDLVPGNDGAALDGQDGHDGSEGPDGAGSTVRARLAGRSTVDPERLSPGV